MDYFSYGEQDFIPCEICGSKAVDIHHIFGRGRGMDEIWNLMALCRNCHIKAHSEGIKYRNTLIKTHGIKLQEYTRNYRIRNDGKENLSRIL